MKTRVQHPKNSCLLLQAPYEAIPEPRTSARYGGECRERAPSGVYHVVGATQGGLPLQSRGHYQGMRDDFSQSVDWSRPLRLMRTGDPRKQGQLFYVYLDTNETVCVPNVAYNQLSCVRRGYADFCVQKKKEHLEALKEQLSTLGLSPEEALSLENLEGLPLPVRQACWAFRDATAALPRLVDWAQSIPA